MRKPKSILHDGESCYLCGRNGCGDPLDWHHIFDGANKKFSEQYGLKVRLCHHRCHIFGKDAVHQSGETYRSKLTGRGLLRKTSEAEKTL